MIGILNEYFNDKNRKKAAEFQLEIDSDLDRSMRQMKRGLYVIITCMIIYLVLSLVELYLKFVGIG